MRGKGLLIAGVLLLVLGGAGAFVGAHLVYDRIREQIQWCTRAYWDAKWAVPGYAVGALGLIILLVGVAVAVGGRPRR